jgi:hypothetical protein
MKGKKWRHGQEENFYFYLKVYRGFIRFIFRSPKTNPSN